jgi:hypothetical protein
MIMLSGEFPDCSAQLDPIHPDPRHSPSTLRPMSPDRGTRDAPLPSMLRDPLVPLDVEGWLRRIGTVLRENARMFLAVGAVLGLLNVAFGVALRIAAPDLDEIGRQLVIAGRDKPGN